MLKSYKTELNSSKEQKHIIQRTIGTCRFVYNFFLAYNKEMYEKEKRFVSGIEFSKWLNNIYLKEHPEYAWIKQVSSKSVKQSIMNAERAFKNFFKYHFRKDGNFVAMSLCDTAPRSCHRFPNFKKKEKSNVKMYFVKTDAKVIIQCQRHRIKIPTLGWVKLKEKGYIPTNSDTHLIKSGTVSYRAGRYYVSVLVEEKEPEKPQLKNFGLGIDLGIKNFAVLSNGMIFKNRNKTEKIRKLEKKLKREQRRLSRKYEGLKKRRGKKGEATRQNIQKQLLKVQKLYQRIETVRTDYVNQCVNKIVKTKPSYGSPKRAVSQSDMATKLPPCYITIEDLNISGMMKNKHLSKAVSSQKFYEFRTKLEYKCKIWQPQRGCVAKRHDSEAVTL